MRYLFKKLIVSANTKIYRNLKTSSTMAKTKLECVKNMEDVNICPSNCWAYVRVNGKKFSKFSKAHEFSKPNDIRALELMNHAAASVMNEFPDVVMAYGQSNEYSFVFRKEPESYNPEESKLMACLDSVFSMEKILSHFSKAYRDHWSKFCTIPLKYLPIFDAEFDHYLSDKTIRNILSLRQAMLHNNNLYNTCFWNLVQKKNMTPVQAQKALKGTVSSDQHELLLHTFNMNYNDELEIFRNGSTLIKKRLPGDSCNCKSTVVTLTCDLIGDKFWEENPQILNPKAHKNNTNEAEENSSV